MRAISRPMGRSYTLIVALCPVARAFCDTSEGGAAADALHAFAS